MTWEDEYLVDPRDTAGAYVLLDGGEVIEPELVPVDEPMPESERARWRARYGRPAR